MDPYGGNNPSSPRLDNSAVPQPAQSENSPVNQGFTPQPQVTAPIIQTPGVPQPSAQTFNPAPPTPSFTPLGIDGSNDLGLSSEPSGLTGGKGKLIAMIAIGGVLLIGLVAGAFFVGNTSGKSQGKKTADAEYQKKEADRQRQEAEANTGSDSADTAQLDLGTELVEPKYTDENVEGDIGKQLTASDGFVLKVTNIERNFKTDDPNYKLDSTKELVKVNFLMGNIAKDKVRDITTAPFFLENSSSARLTPESIVTYPGKFNTITLDPGTQNKGSIVYLVNKDEKPLKFIRTQAYRLVDKNSVITTNTIVSLAE